MAWRLRRFFSPDRASAPDASELLRRGTAHVCNQDWQLARESFLQAARSNPNLAEAHAYLGNVLRHLRDFDGAIEAYARALAIKPDYAEVFYNRGTLLQQKQQCKAAADSFESALAINESMVLAHTRLGDVRWAMGELEAAEASYRRATALAPDNVEAYSNLGVLQSNAGNHVGALKSFDAAVQLRPDFARAVSGRAQAQARLGLSSEARASHDQAALLDPQDAQILINRGDFLIDQREWQAAAQNYLAAIVLQPHRADAHGNLGLCQEEMGEGELALVSYENALALNPRLPAVFNNRGNVLRSRKQFAEAMRDYAAALALDPGHVEAHYNIGQLSLLQGNFTIGWPEYEWRGLIEEAADATRNNRHEPAWTGDEPLQGKRIVLYAEQGLGDTIQFCRYVSLVAALGAHVILEVQPALCRILGRLPGVSELVASGSPVPPADYQCSLMSLPGAFKSALETIPCEVPYIFADPQKLELCRTTLGPRLRPRVGLAWSGNPRQRNDRHRTIALSQLIKDLPGEFDYYCLQKDIRDEDKQTLWASRIKLHEPLVETFESTAVLLESLDLVITVCTSIAHLSGAMGKPTWVMLPFLPDWRWMLDRSDSPWYPTMTLYRQSAVDDWSSVMSEIKRSLASRFSNNLKNV